MKVTPRTREQKQVDLTTLEVGQVFLWHGALWIKLKDDNQGVANLETGEVFFENCGEYVVPVDATLTWKYKKVTPKKKK